MTLSHRYSVFLLFLASCLRLCPASTSCIPKAAGHPDEGDDQYKRVDIPNECRDGAIEWDHPKGYLYVAVALGLTHTFQFCMFAPESGDFDTLMDNTNFHHKYVDKPTAGKPTCFDSDNSQTFVVLKANIGDHSKLVFKYHILKTS